jgi:hypothetical protein
MAEQRQAAANSYKTEWLLAPVRFDHFVEYVLNCVFVGEK